MKTYMVLSQDDERVKFGSKTNDNSDLSIKLMPQVLLKCIKNMIEIKISLLV